MPNLNSVTANTPVSQPLRAEAVKSSAAAVQTETKPAHGTEKLTVSEAGQRGQAATEVSFGDRLGTASKFGMSAMLGGVVIGAVAGARAGSKGGGDYGAMIGFVLGGAVGALKGGAIGLAAGGATGLAYSYATEKNAPAQAATAATPPSAGGTAVTEAKGIEADKPVSKGGNMFGSISKGAVTGTVAGTVIGAVVGGVKGGAGGGGNFPLMGVVFGGLHGALVGAGVGLVGGGATGAILHANKK